MEQQTFTISFEGVSQAAANRYASELRNVILDATTDVEVERKRDDPRTQDFGATLLLALGTSAIPAIVKAIGDWLALHHKVGITIKTAKGEVIATNLTTHDAMKLADRL